jgi:cytochrome bd-type quinol oxidase subunit 2
MAFAFPILLWLGGHFLAGISLQDSMSAYYHASLNALGPGPAGQGVMRDVFVGLLFAVGAILFLYQGASNLEDYALNLAGILAVGIALFPMQWGSTNPADPRAPYHQWFAIGFFLCIAYVAIFRAGDTVQLIEKAKRASYRRAYKITGAAMIALPAMAFVSSFFPGMMRYKLFLIEAAGIYAFGLYWVIKTRELSKSDFDRKAARGEIQVEPHGLSDVVSRIDLKKTP